MSKPKLVDTLRCWRSPGRAGALRAELQGLAPGVLPLHLGTNEGGMVDEGELQVTVIRSSDDAATMHAVVGVFFTEIVGGCSCGDEALAKPAYCELRVRIDGATAEAEFELLPG